jgi:hypothetical protein
VVVIWALPSIPYSSLGSKRRAMGLSERELEHHRHLDDLLSRPTNASTLAASARSRDIVQDVHQSGCDACRVRRALFHPQHRSSRQLGPR